MSAVGTPRCGWSRFWTAAGRREGLRSGTLNVPGIVGFARALELCQEEMPAEAQRLRTLRNRLYQGIIASTTGVDLNGPALEPPEWRLPGNLNLSFAGLEGESLLLNMQDLALSSGSACTSEKPEPSHVLRALGIDDQRTRSSLRFGLGRFNTPEEVEYAIQVLSETVQRLRRLNALPLIDPSG